jgi:hypothetical protein
MKPKRIPSPDELAMLEAMANPDPAAWDSWVKSQGLQPDPDLPVCLATIPPDQWIENSKVLPTPAIARYLESDDTLTDHTIDMMELAIEKAYQVSEPWCIVSIRDGAEGQGNLAVRYFYLLRE